MSVAVMLRDDNVAKIRHLFATEHLELLIDAIAAGTSPAQVWCDDLASPRCALVWDGAHNVYLVGAVDRPDQWRRLFDVEVAPVARGTLKLHVSEAATSSVFGGDALPRRERVLYRGGRGVDASRLENLPTGFEISSINERFADLAALRNAADVIAEIESCWTTLAAFQQRGFGFCAHDAEQIVCWCTAEYVSASRCGIGIETVATHRGQGFATRTATAFAQDCLARRVVPYWDAWTSNLPSVAVAQKLGFRVAETYTVLVVDAADLRP